MHHLENIKLQLETRVRELEVANKQLESCLQCLQTNKVSPSYFDLTSSESSRTGSPTSKKNFPFDFDYSTSKSGTTTTGYSSSLPSSPNHNKRPPSPLASSMPHSPVSASEENYFVQGLWVASGNSCKAPRRSIYDDVFNSKSDNRVLVSTFKYFFIFTCYVLIFQYQINLILFYRQHRCEKILVKTVLPHRILV